MYNNNINVKQTTYSAPREIKASAHYAYIDRGITLDGSKFADGELLLEGQCLMMDDTTKKYEKYADANPTAASVTGTAAVTPADCSGLHANTKLVITVNGTAYTVANAALKSIGVATTGADIIALLGNAVNADGGKLSAVADITIDDDTDIMTIATKKKDASASLYIKGTWGAANDEATVEGVLGIADGSLDYGTGTFPAGKSNPVILDESVKIPVDANGDNVDVTAGQVIVHGAVYESMLIGCTAAFKDATKGAILYR